VADASKARNLERQARGRNVDPHAAADNGYQFLLAETQAKVVHRPHHYPSMVKALAGVASHCMPQRIDVAITRFCASGVRARGSTVGFMAIAG
jgi:hypothetical protein